VITAHEALSDPHTGYRLESADHSHASTGLQGGTIAHSATTGQTATDHHVAPAAGPDADVTIDAAGAAGTASTFARSGHGHKLATSATAGAAIGTAAAGTSGHAPSRDDHVHPTGAGTPAAVSTANAVGTGPAAAMTDHVHAHEAAHLVHDTNIAAKGDLFAGTANDTVGILTAGTNDQILMAESAEVTGLKWVSSQTPSTQAYSDAAAEGTADTFARGDHKHGMPAAGGGTTIANDTIWAAKGDIVGATANDAASVLTVGANDTILMADSAAATGLKWVASATPSTQAFGDAAAVGTGDTFTRGDHKHAMPSLGTGATNAAAGNDARIPTTGEHTWLTNGLAGQVAFPATQAPSAGANVLDDYEEGTWTPAPAFATPGTSSWATPTAQGIYTKIGRLVTATLYYDATLTKGTGTGILGFSGLPFNPSFATMTYWTGPGQLEPFTLANVASMALYADSTNKFYYYAVLTTGAFGTYIGAAHLANGAVYFYGQMTYSV
jgi:hypothetical protein